VAIKSGSTRRKPVKPIFAALCLSVMAVVAWSPVGASAFSQGPRGPIAGAAKHKDPKPIALAIEYLADSRFDDTDTSATAPSPQAQELFDFCDAHKDRFTYGLVVVHPSATDPGVWIQSNTFGSWDVTHATLTKRLYRDPTGAKRRQLRTATIAYTVLEFHSFTEPAGLNSPPFTPYAADPPPPSTGVYSLTAHRSPSPFGSTTISGVPVGSGTINGTTYRRTAHCKPDSPDLRTVPALAVERGRVRPPAL
jgi:hypothetical protein